MKEDLTPTGSLMKDQEYFMKRIKNILQRDPIVKNIIETAKVGKKKTRVILLKTITFSN
jgi:hypothetical protein